MPHNRTRTWVGLAIAAVTIPVAAQYVYRSSTNDSRAQSLIQAARWNASNSLYDTRHDLHLASAPAARDYLAEVNAAVGKQGVVFASGKAYPYDNGPDYPYDDSPAAEYAATDAAVFDIDPLSYDDAVPEGAAGLESPAFVAPDPDQDPNGVQADDSPTVDDGQAVADEGLSDRAIYATVVNNLPPADRDEFVRAWTAMTPDQRADLIDGFRENLQGGGN